MGLIFYATQANEVVLEKLRGLARDVRAHVGAKIRAAQDVDFQLGLPHLRKIQGDAYKGLSELRIPFQGETYRLLLFRHGEETVAVEFEDKKGRKLPAHVLKTARARMIDWQRRNPLV